MSAAVAGPTSIRPTRSYTTLRDATFRRVSRDSEAPSSPRALFRDLARDPDVRFLWAHQDRILEGYENGAGIRDLALELPTGTGKTLIGLLIAEWRRKARGERVLYFVPDPAARAPGGRARPGWHRVTYDGYGEQANGDDWDLFFDNPQRQTRGRLWPLLAGERGEYELIAGRDARPRLRTIAHTVNDGLMLPEQVWDDQPPPGETSGEGTRSATPLAWTHAQFVRLVWTITAGEPIERPSIVACRYTGTDC